MNKSKIPLLILMIISIIKSTIIYSLIREYNYGNDLSTNLGFLLGIFLGLFIYCIDKILPIKVESE